MPTSGVAMLSHLSAQSNVLHDLCTSLFVPSPCCGLPKLSFRRTYPSACMRIALLHCLRASTCRAIAVCDAAGHRAVRQRHNAIPIGRETTAVLRARKSMQ
eukprot:302316-Pleurochrysis_carterae.AAC.1